MNPWGIILQLKKQIFRLTEQLRQSKQREQSGRELISDLKAMITSMELRRKNSEGWKMEARINELYEEMERLHEYKFEVEGLEKSVKRHRKEIRQLRRENKKLSNQVKLKDAIISDSDIKKRFDEGLEVVRWVAQSEVYGTCFYCGFDISGDMAEHADDCILFKARKVIS